jgi:hypothetical protein
LSIDFTVANNISVGGSIAFISRSGKTDQLRSSVTTSVDSPTIIGFAFAPRVGYILSVNQMIGIWLKGGVTYFSLKSDSTFMGSSRTLTDTGFSLNLEPELVVLPVPHFGFTVSGLGDIALSGNHNETTTGAVATSTDEGFKVNNFGLALGLLGFI